MKLEPKLIALAEKRGESTAPWNSLGPALR